VVRIKDGRRELVMLKWGWGKMKKPPGKEWVNARSEGRDSAAYAQSFKLRRCLIPRALPRRLECRPAGIGRRTGPPRRRALRRLLSAGGAATG
jgi:hypothetical protein